MKYAASLGQNRHGLKVFLVYFRQGRVLVTVVPASGSTADNATMKPDMKGVDARRRAAWLPIFGLTTRVAGLLAGLPAAPAREAAA